MANQAAVSKLHIFHGGRLTAFSDAVFSIIATFSVSSCSLKLVVCYLLLHTGDSIEV